jgi:hypothetical protein
MRKSNQLIRSSWGVQNPVMDIRRHKWNLLFLAAATMVAMVTVAYLWLYHDRGPTSEEFRVYSSLLDRFDADEHLRRNDLALLSHTLETPDTQSDGWIPAELLSDRSQPPSEFVSFCGYLCGQDFAKKNLVVWWLRPSTAEFAFSVVAEGNHSQMYTGQYEVAVTRVGFNTLRTRAVLEYTADCIMSVCAKSGSAYFVKEHGIWRVEHY